MPIGLFFGGLAIAIAFSKISNGIDGSELVGFVFALLLDPVLWKRLRGGATWRREVHIDGAGVSGTDRFGGGVV